MTNPTVSFAVESAGKPPVAVMTVNAEKTSVRIESVVLSPDEAATVCAIYLRWYETFYRTGKVVLK